MSIETTALEETEDLLDVPLEVSAEETESEEEERAKEKIRRKVVRGERKPSLVQKELREQREETLSEFLSGLGAGTDEIRIFVDRKLPKQWTDPVSGQVHNIEGRIDQFDELFTEEDLKERFGGGKYAIAVQQRSPSGKYQFVAHKTIKIAGPPNVSSILGAGAQAPAKNGEDLGAVRMAMDTMKTVMDRESKSSPMIETFMQNMQNELSEARRVAADKDRQIIELIGKKPEASTADRLLEVMMTSESSRLDAVRTQYDTELRTVRERNGAELDRVHGFYQTQLASKEAASARELDNLKLSFNSQIEQIKIAHEGVKNGLQREIKHLDSLLSEAKTELIALRSQKQKSPIEQLQEVAALKDAISEFGGGDGEEGGGSALEKVMEAVAPLLQGIGSRISDGPGMAPQMMQPPQQAPIAPNQSVTLPDGRVVGRDASGNPVEIRRKKRPTVEVQGDAKPVILDPTDLKAAISFMEIAFRGGQDPLIFASTVRSVVPPSIQKAFAANKQGVDHFLDEVANLEPTSPLATQAGRTWLREVAKHVFV